MKLFVYVAVVSYRLLTTPLWAQAPPVENSWAALVRTELQAYERWDLIFLGVLSGAIVGISLFQRWKQRRQLSKRSAPLLLLDDRAKAKLILCNGADVWLPYTIPLFATTTKLGSASHRLLDSLASKDVLDNKDESIFELLSSPFIDEEHCVIQAMQDGFMIFDVARFNNTSVDGRLVPPGGLPLAPGAVIALGHIEYVFLPREGARVHNAR